MYNRKTWKATGEKIIYIHIAVIKRRAHKLKGKIKV
jgi:hypothetical protein